MPRNVNDSSVLVYSRPSHAGCWTVIGKLSEFSQERAGDVMPDNLAELPDQTSTDGDPGDETARRYRYQWTCAAIMSCMLLDDTQNVLELLCEQHEDVLLKHNDGAFTGLQIKTRASDQEPWKANDLAVRNSCARFASLEARFPGQFRAFRFLTNHPLYSAGNGRDLVWLLGDIKAARDLANLKQAAASFLQRVARNAGCPEEVAFVALSKTEASDDLPKLRDALSRLVDSLTPVWIRAAHCSHDSVVRAAQALIEECGRASSLAHTELLPAYLAAGSDPEDAELAARLNGKRIDRVRVQRVLERGLDETLPLHGDPEDIPEPGTGATVLLRRKLDAGGFSAVSLNSAEDLRDKADYLGIAWTKKYGRTSGLQRYSHVRSLVLRDAAGAFEFAKSGDRPFGNDMLSQLRARFARRRAEHAQLHGCSDEHLEGLAYSLTSQCEVVWSLDRPWEEL